MLLDSTGQVGIENVLRSIIVKTAVKVLNFLADE